jgi:hypothetical protein
MIALEVIFIMCAYRYTQQEVQSKYNLIPHIDRAHRSLIATTVRMSARGAIQLPARPPQGSLQMATRIGPSQSPTPSLP